jgi:hypothetical protein
MREYTKIASDAGDRVLSTIKQAQKAVVNAVSTASGTLGNYVPEVPNTPVTESIPNPKVFVETYFDFVEELLKSQKRYALDLLKAVEPVTSKVLPNVKPRAKKSAAAATTAA